MRKNERWNKLNNRKMTVSVSREVIERKLRTSMKYIMTQEMLCRERKCSNGQVYLLRKGG